MNKLLLFALLAGAVASNSPYAGEGMRVVPEINNSPFLEPDSDGADRRVAGVLTEL